MAFAVGTPMHKQQVMTPSLTPNLCTPSSRNTNRRRHRLSRTACQSIERRIIPQRAFITHPKSLHSQQQESREAREQNPTPQGNPKQQVEGKGSADN